jgi:hypothetical protein
VAAIAAVRIFMSWFPPETWPQLIGNAHGIGVAGCLGDAMPHARRVPDR